MLFSDSPIRRYTPPTCSLEIWAKGSPLSRWLRRAAINDWRFALHFDDPRLPEAEQVILHGSREELELLGEAVSNYLQNFLGQTGRLVSGSETAVPALLSGMTAAPASTVSQQYLTETAAASALAALPTSPILKSSNWLAHELTLGSLALDASQPAVKLSTSQLFDLANALENYNTESSTLAANLPKAKTRFFWLAGAAALLAVGLGAIAAWRFGWLDRTADSLAFRQNSASQPLRSNITDVLPPVPPPPAQPAPSPTLPPSLARQKDLKPPATVKSPGSSPIPQIVLPQPNSASPPPPQSQRQQIAIVPQESEKAASAKIANPQIPQLPPLSSRPRATGADSQFDANSGDLTRRNGSNPAEAPMLLDTIPQVAEARHYFQERWTAPEGLNQRLEYRLLVNREGSLERIVPLGRAAQIYLDRTGMPLLGEPFVSPLQDTEMATVRLVLTPDSKVKTFLE
jgi:hypothetical protein